MVATQAGRDGPPSCLEPRRRRRRRAPAPHRLRRGCAAGEHACRAGATRPYPGAHGPRPRDIPAPHRAARPTRKNRTQFFAVAATAMRRILVDHARRHGARKRGGSWDRISFDESRRAWPGQPDVNILALEEGWRTSRSWTPQRECGWSAALLRRARSGGDGGRARGLRIDGCTREWRLARAWLFRRLGGPARPA